MRCRAAQLCHKCRGSWRVAGGPRSARPDRRPAIRPPTALEQLVDDYLMACRAKGLAPNTITNSYGYPLRSIFLPWCSDRGIVDLAGLTSRTPNAFSVYLAETPMARGKTLSKASVHAYSRAVRGFLNWCEREGEAVAAKPSLPQLPRRVLDVLDREEIRRLVAAAPTERDKLILSILSDCGLRNTELCRLETGDILRRDRQAFLRVHGKGARGASCRCHPPSCAGWSGTSGTRDQRTLGASASSSACAVAAAGITSL